MMEPGKSCTNLSHLSPHNVTISKGDALITAASQQHLKPQIIENIFFSAQMWNKSISQLATKICIKGYKRSSPTALSETVRFFKIAAESWSVKLKSPFEMLQKLVVIS